MIPSQPTDAAQQPEKVASRPSWKRLSLRGMMVFTAGFAFTLWTAKGSENPVTDGLIAAFLVIWFWRQYEDSRTPVGAVCGLATMLIVLLAGQSMIAFWALREFGKRWTLFGSEIPANTLLFPFDAINEVLIWFPVLITALPADTTQEQAFTWRNLAFNLAGVISGLVMMFCLVMDDTVIITFVAVSIRGMFYGSILDYDGMAEEAATELLFSPSLVALLFVCGGIILFVISRFLSSVIGLAAKVSAVLLSVTSIGISWNLLTYLIPASAPVLFAFSPKFTSSPGIIWYLVASTVAVLTFRFQIPPCEVHVHESWFSWKAIRSGWVERMFRQGPALIGFTVACYILCAFIVRHSQFIAGWNAQLLFSGNNLLPPTLIVIGAHLSRQRWNVAGAPPISASKFRRGDWAMDTASAIIQLVALAMALYVFAYTVQMIRESPLDWITPRPFLKAE